jgi:salicylate hydroxylase/6-hydroxynicotinate 3-monooxygenase
MVPYMAQGATSAIEDAAILARCLEEGGDYPEVFRRYEATRKERVSLIQLTSHKNQWMSARTDPDWVYGYDALTVSLAQRSSIAAPTLSLA